MLPWYPTSLGRLLGMACVDKYLLSAGCRVQLPPSAIKAAVLMWELVLRPSILHPGYSSGDLLGIYWNPISCNCVVELCSVGLPVRPDAVQQAQALVPVDSPRASRMLHLGKEPLGSPQPQHAPGPIRSPCMGESPMLSCTCCIILFLSLRVSLGVKGQ